jgi:small subunit ribosomal protein S7
MSEQQEEPQSTESKEPIGNMKVFGKFSLAEVKVEDPGLKRYLNLDAKLVLKTHGRSVEKFGKAKVNVLERVIGMLGVPGHRGKKHKQMVNWNSGKYSKNVKILIEALEIIEKQTGKNPVAVLVKAIENVAPRDEITVIEYGGARYPQAVDTAPMRRLHFAIRNLVHGAADKSFNKKMNIAEGLAKEILLAYENSSESMAYTKKNESEKQADSAR